MEQQLGTLLEDHHHDELEATRHLLSNVDPQKAVEVLPLITILLNNKALPNLQRRDLPGIARLVADSPLLSTLGQSIRLEVSEKKEPWVIFEGVLRLVQELCWENPHLIEDLLVSSRDTVDLVLELLQKE